MARVPFARWKPLPAHGDEPSIRPRTVIYHTMVGTLAGVDSYFRSGRSGGIESHFGVGCAKCVSDGVTSVDGEIWQWMDTGEQADANYHANAFAISVETCDHYRGGTYTNPPLSPGQVQAWTRLGIWAHDTHGIARRRCPAWDEGGYGYHSLFGAPSEWTPAAGKTCPNPTRIRQFNDVVLPAIIRGDLEEDDLPYTEAQLDAIVQKAVEDALFKSTFPATVPSNTVASKLNKIRDNTDGTVEAVKATGDGPIADILRRVSNSDEIEARQLAACRLLLWQVEHLGEPAPADLVAALQATMPA